MNKQISLRVRITPQENELIKRLAQREGQNISEFLRLAIREAAKNRGIPALGLAELFEVTPIEEVQNAPR